MVYRRSGQPPLVVSDASLEAYKLGAGLGREDAIAERETTQPAFDDSSIGLDLGGKKFDKFEARLREQLEALFHKHMPHIEVEETEIPSCDFTVIDGQGVLRRFERHAREVQYGSSSLSDLRLARNYRKEIG